MESTVTLISARYGDRLCLSVEEAAEVCGIGRSKLYELIAQDRFPPVYRADGATRVWLPKLIEWIEAGGAAPEPAPRRAGSSKMVKPRRSQGTRTFSAYLAEAQAA